MSPFLTMFSTAYYISLVYQNVALCGNGLDIFSSGVFRENPRYCYSLGIIVVVQKLAFCKISVITEDIYLKLGLCVHYQRSNPYYQGRQFKMHFFFSQIYALFQLKTFNPLSSTPQQSVGTCMLCSCLWTNNDLKLTAFFFLKYCGKSMKPAASGLIVLIEISKL